MPAPAGELPDYFALIKESRRVPHSAADAALRVFLMADCASQQLTQLLRALLHRAQIDADVRESEYDTTDQEIINPGSSLNRFNPQTVVLLNCTQKLRQRYLAAEPPRDALPDELFEELRRRWDALRSRHPDLTVIQSTFAPPVEGEFGNFSSKCSESFIWLVAELNHRIRQHARNDNRILILDIGQSASWMGLKSWYDPKLWFLSKSLASPEGLVLATRGLSDILRCLAGRLTKCVVVDLDNTLWGGIIGDDGIEGIVLGDHAEGEAFVAFQHHLLELKKRGILLAVCSKNDPANALLPFQKHPDMVLKEKDFAAFKANWKNKADNIAEIQRELNIGLDSMVFLDDDPFERNLVREHLPEVIVPDLPNDAAEYVKCLAGLNLFETISVSGTDAERTELYHAENRRKQAAKVFDNPV
ncbi:MAG: HAD-IIIC family phosphatase, partial [Candidatus Omnitrophica bacterium]|nr:HAD-IIIC family phosphatase [Candidatus Omnitrophota bacterium]